MVRPTKSPMTIGGAHLRRRVLELLNDQPQTLTQLGAQTGYDWHQLADALAKLRASGRARWAATGWVRASKVEGFPLERG